MLGYRHTGSPSPAVDTSGFTVFTAMAQLKFKSSQSVSDPTIVTGSGYWSATVTHSQILNFTCAIAVNTVNPLVATAGEGEPVCR